MKARRQGGKGWGAGTRYPRVGVGRALGPGGPGDSWGSAEREHPILTPGPPGGVRVLLRQFVRHTVRVPGVLAFPRCFQNPRRSFSMASFPEMCSWFVGQKLQGKMVAFCPILLLVCIFTFFSPILKMLQLLQYEKKKKKANTSCFNQREKAESDDSGLWILQEGVFGSRAELQEH